MAGCLPPGAGRGECQRIAPRRLANGAPDGQRFVLVRGVAAAAETELVLVQNWFEELKTRTRK